MPYRIGVACSTGVGPERGGRARNEDNFLICCDGRVRYLEEQAERVLDRPGDGVVVAVCDGMGGHDDGHVASLTAAKVLSRLYQPGVPSNPERALLRYIRDSHLTLHYKAAEHGPVAMGTTVTIAWLVHGTLSWVNVGDSRLYRLRGDELELLSLDHTRNEFARRDGRTMISADDDHLVQTFIYGSRGLGDNTALRLEPGLDSGVAPLESEDVLLLCTDGVWGSLDADHIARVLAAQADPQLAADELVRDAIARGTTDNLTALVVAVGPQEPPVVEWTDDFDILRTI